MDVKRKRNVPIRVAVILLCLVFFSTHLMSGMLAKYVVGVDGSATARTAKADLSVSSFTSSENGSYEFSVVNNSEVAFSFDVIIAVKDNEDGIDVTQALDSVKLNGSSADSVSFDGKVFTFSDVDQIAASSTVPDLQLTIDSKHFFIYSTSNTDHVSQTEFPFTVMVKGYQID